MNFKSGNYVEAAFPSDRQSSSAGTNALNGKFPEALTKPYKNLIREHISVHSEDFKSKVISLAKHLKVQSHPDHEVVLTACCMVIKNTLGTKKQLAKV
jgi:hypothetical protein